jgi:hypothetical protein
VARTGCPVRKKDCQKALGTQAASHLHQRGMDSPE